MRQRKQPPTAKPKRRPKAAPKRQPKRILNCVPSPETDEDWRLETAEDAGLVAAAPQIPAAQGPAGARGGRSTIRARPARASAGRAPTRVLRWHFVKTNRIGQSELISPRFQWMAAKETDEFNSRPTTFVEAEGTSLKAALDVARKFGSVKDTVLPFASAIGYRGSAVDVLRDRRPAEDQHVLQPRQGDRELARLARDEGADPDPAQRRLDLGQGDRDEGRARRLQAEDGARRPRGRARRLHAGRDSSSGTAGARAGATAASRTRRSPTRRRRSPRPTGSSPSRRCKLR